MIVNITNTTEFLVTINDLGVSINANETIDLASVKTLADISESSDLLVKIAVGTLTVNDGIYDLTPDKAVIYVTAFKNVGPIMSDGRPLVRADTRPIGTRTFFTMAGDSVLTGEHGAGKEFRWDFSNDDDLYNPDDVTNGPTLVSGVKAKRIDLYFNEPVYLKDGAMYFFDCPWGCYGSMYITVPAGGYYPDEDGSIPASALGLSGNTMYSYAAKDFFYSSYVLKHFMYGDCPMGDELNAEGCQIDPIPSGWLVTGLIVTPESDTSSKGYVSFEMYRESLR